MSYYSAEVLMVSLKERVSSMGRRVVSVGSSDNVPYLKKKKQEALKEVGSKASDSTFSTSGPILVAIERHLGFLGHLFSGVGDIDPFLLGIQEAQFTHNILYHLPCLDIQRRLDGTAFDELVNFHDVRALQFVMSNSMRNDKDHTLSGDVSRLYCKVVTLKGQRTVFIHNISKLEANLENARNNLDVEGTQPIRDLRFESLKLSIELEALKESLHASRSSKKVLEEDYKLLHQKYRGFKEKEDVFLAKEFSIRGEIDVLHEKLSFSNQKCVSLIKDFFAHAIGKLLSSEQFSVVLANLQRNNIPMLRDVKSWLGNNFSIKDLREAVNIHEMKIIRDGSKRLIALSQSETDIQEKDKKKAKSKQSRARDGKAEVKIQPNEGKAEYIVAPKASMEAVSMWKFIYGHENVMPTRKEHLEILCDNTGVTAIANDPRIMKGARHY
ncbi:hypothetical protein Tco_0151662 [Tanacetum coccineum]